MFDSSRLKEVLIEYKKNFVPHRWGNEKYKWEAVKHFQDNWDVNATDFAAVLEQSLAKTHNLLASKGNFSIRMIVGFAKTAPEEVRSLFIALFDEGNDYYERVEAFKQGSAALLEKYGNGVKQHYQHENAITTYLWLRYPDRYYIYKFGVVNKVAKELDANYRFKRGAYAENVRNHLAFYDEVCAELKKDNELVRMAQSQVIPECYPDPELHTLTIDVCFYISRYVSGNREDTKTTDWSPAKEEYNPGLSADDNASHAVCLTSGSDNEGTCGYWWLNASPKIWSFSELSVGEVQSYTLYNENGNKRRIFQNFLEAKAGDMVIGYESNPVKQVVAIARITSEQDGERLYFEKVEGLATPIDYQTLRECPELKKMEYFLNPQGSLFKLTPDEYGSILDLIREENPLTEERAAETYTREDFLKDVYMTEERYDHLVSVLRNKKNVILQGAPGVGKTFAANRLAWSLMGEKDENRIEFIQFHQDYSYEDFMMGYKPVGNTFELKYGVFYRFCQKAANHPDKEFFFIIDEINRGNMSKIFGELLMLIERDYRGHKTTLAYNGLPFSVPANLYIIGMMNTADRSLAMIDYAPRRRFSFFEMEPGFDSEGFAAYQKELASDTLDELVMKIKELNAEIARDKSLGRGFCIGHSYFCGCDTASDEWLREVVDYDILPMLSEYWFDDEAKVTRWKNVLHGVFQQ